MVAFQSIKQPTNLLFLFEKKQQTTKLSYYFCAHHRLSRVNLCKIPFKFILKLQGFPNMA
uniref:Uncharacterized protein n=1 Tax=Aegilops tauschii subsp. strangulata TaxID=200361 RepID=A0A453PY71_AEGTS